MERCATAVHRLVDALLPFVPQLVPTNRLRQIFHRALTFNAALRSTVPGSRQIVIELQFRIAFQSEDAEPETEVDIVELDPTVEPPEPAQVEPPIEDMIPDMPAPHAPLMGSLYGILDHHDS